MMIAVVILGLGLVMVATLFPVAIEQNRVAIQQSTVPAVARHALQTLRTRLQTVTAEAMAGSVEPEHLSDYPGDRPYPSDLADGNDEPFTDYTGNAFPVMPSMYDINLTNQIGFPAQILKSTGQASNPQFGSIPKSTPRAFRVVRGANMRRPPEEDDQTDVEYTGDATPDGVLWDFAYENILYPSIPSQFPQSEQPEPLFADLGPNHTPHWFDQRPGTYPKIDILDRVYPPVTPRFPKQPLRSTSSEEYARWHDLREAADRRYFWTAFCAPATGKVGPSGQDIEVRIAVTFRAEPSAKYAAQNIDLDQPERFNKPQAYDKESDTVFPQPWLVKFEDENALTFPHANYTPDPCPNNSAVPLLAGEVRCEKHVGRLLPVGAIFIDFERGRAHQVLQNAPDPDNGDYRRLLVTTDASLEIPSGIDARQMLYQYPDFPDYAWVFPPPVLHIGGPDYDDDAVFQGKCPVLDVIEGSIPRQ